MGDRPPKVLHENLPAAAIRSVDDYLFVATASNDAELKAAEAGLSARIDKHWQRSGVIILAQDFALTKRGRDSDDVLDEGVTIVCSEDENLELGKKKFIDDYLYTQVLFLQPHRKPHRNPHETGRGQSHELGSAQRGGDQAASTGVESGSHPIPPSGGPPVVRPVGS
jgi:hypothetical protein